MVEIIENSKYNHSKKTSVDESYFEKIDRKDKAYFLGLMYADGHMSKTRNKIQINLQEKDRHILEKFKECIKYTGKVGTWIKKAPRQNQASLGIYNNKIYGDLTILGCNTNKSYELSIPNIPNNYKVHFIRGFFDGDGSISVGKKRVRISFTCLEKIAQEIKDFISLYNIKMKISSIKKGKYSEDFSNLVTLLIDSKTEGEKFMRLLYTNCDDLYLLRKYEIYKKCFIIDKMHIFNKYTKKEFLKEDKSKINWVERY